MGGNSIKTIPIRDIISSSVISFHPESMLSVAANVMVEKSISCLVAVDGDNPVGIITERDIVKFVLNKIDFEQTKVKDVMVSPLHTATFHIDIFEAYEILAGNNIRHLVIIKDDGTLKGVVTQSDLIRSLGLDRGEIRKVSTIMSKEYLSFDKGTSLEFAVKEMAEKKKSFFVVEDNGTAVGFLSERDITRLATQHKCIETSRLGDVMNHPVNTIDPNTPITEVARLMRQYGKRRLVVATADGKTAGVVTQKDLLAGVLEGRYIEPLKDIIAKRDQVLSSVEKTLIEKMIFLDSILTSAKELAVIATDENMKIVYYNPVAQETFGMHLSVVMGKTVKEVHAMTDGKFKNFDSAMAQVRETGEFSTVVEFKRDGKKVQVGFRVSPIVDFRDAKKGFKGYLLMGRDLADRRRNEDKLKESEQKWRSLFSDSKDVVYMIDEKGGIKEINQTAVELFGYSHEALLGMNMKTLFADSEDMNKFMLESLEEVYLKDYEAEMSTKSGGTIYTHITSAVQKDRSRDVIGFQGIIRDVTERKKKEDVINFLAYHDALTGLPNRRTFADRLKTALASSKRSKTTGAIMFMDLDHFKEVNDTLGHDVGDELLKEVSNMIGECLRDEDTVSRFGGDEFVILLPHVAKVNDASLVADKIVKAFHPKLTIMDHEVQVSMSIGVCIFPDHGTDEEELTKKADDAMYSAKQAGRNNYKIYSPPKS